MVEHLLGAGCWAVHQAFDGNRTWALCRSGSKLMDTWIGVEVVGAVTETCAEHPGSASYLEVGCEGVSEKVSSIGVL